ncbi:MAG: hypothetical protein ABSA44_03475 [Bacteroidota bacterium]|jgi:hypothetical protein
MGTSTLLDILGSLTTFGFLLLIALGLNANASEKNTEYFASYLLQSNMITLTVMLEDDLKHIGQNYTPTVANPTAIMTADSLEFSFYRNGDLIDYVVGAPLGIGQYPNSRYVYRNVNGTQNLMNLGVIHMTFTYWDIADPTIKRYPPVPQANFGNIGPIDISIQMESPYKRKPDYSNAADTSEYEMYWRQIRSIARTTLVQIPGP